MKTNAIKYRWQNCISRVESCNFVRKNIYFVLNILPKLSHKFIFTIIYSFQNCTSLTELRFKNNLHFGHWTYIWIFNNKHSKSTFNFFKSLLNLKLQLRIQNKKLTIWSEWNNARIQAVFHSFQNGWLGYFPWLTNKYIFCRDLETLSENELWWNVVAIELWLMVWNGETWN